MPDHDLPPTRSILSLTDRLSAFAPVAGAAATFGALGAVHLAAAVLIGVLATFVTFAGSLMISDWQADTRSRYDWAEIGLTTTHLSLTVEAGPASDIGPCYLATGSDEALQRVFRAHRAAVQMVCNSPLSTRPASLPPSQPNRDQGRAAAAPLEAHAFEHALRPMAGAPSRVARARKGKRRGTEIAPRLRLVANGDAWPLWTTRIGPAAQGAAQVIVLSAGLDDQAQSQPEASIGPSKAESTEPVSLHSTTNDSDTPAARRVGRRVATDDLGLKIPITREELDAIETYLEADLRELFSSRTPRGSREDI